MAGASLLALIDDIASLLDDIALMSKVAAKKTAGVLGDDLALNAQQVSGVTASRELPIVWAVAKGSLKNKAILVPSALIISAILPAAITPLLMIGGAFLCFEGVEKIVHSLLHSPSTPEEKEMHLNALSADSATIEADKIRGAIRTDFILSAEIVVISLGTVATETFIAKMSVLAIISILMTFGVYGLVAGIVKLDDAGYYLSKKEGRLPQVLGRILIHSAPNLMKGLSIVGTIAMFTVGGSILMHGIPALHELSHPIEQVVSALPVIGSLFAAILPLLLDIIVGLLIGFVVFGCVVLAKRLLSKRS